MSEEELAVYRTAFGIGLGQTARNIILFHYVAWYLILTHPTNVAQRARRA